MSPGKTTRNLRTARNHGGDLTWRDMLTPRRIAALVIAALGVVFIAENTGMTKIRLIFSEVTMPLWLALLGMGVIGVLCGVLLRRRR